MKIYSIKNATILFFAFMLCELSTMNISFSQTALGGCNTVTLTSVPLYPTNLIAKGAWKPCSSCDANCEALYLTSPPIYMQTQNWLEKKDETSSVWTTVQGPVYGDNTVFNVADRGRYRIRVHTPRRRTSGQCFNGITVLNFWTGSSIGFKGVYVPYQASWTNEVVVGATLPSDRVTTFIDTNGDMLPNAYDFGDEAILDASDSQNYNLWFLAIKETGSSSNRWKGTGWQYGTVDQFNLSNFWDSYDFKPFHQYTVQFVIDNHQCRHGIESPNTSNDGWYNTKTFFVCPTGTGCRTSHEEKEITLSPNPASNHFNLNNFDMALDQGYQLMIYDITGRIVKDMNLTKASVDVSDLPTGVFTVRIHNKDNELLNTRLVINK